MSNINNNFIKDFNMSVNEFLDDLKILVNDNLFNKFYINCKRLLSSNFGTEILINKYIINFILYSKYIEEKRFLFIECHK